MLLASGWRTYRSCRRSGKTKDGPLAFGFRDLAAWTGHCGPTLNAHLASLVYGGYVRTTGRGRYRVTGKGIRRTSADGRYVRLPIAEVPALSISSAQHRGSSHASTMARWRAVSCTATWSPSNSPPTWSAWSLSMSARDGSGRSPSASPATRSAPVPTVGRRSTAGAPSVTSESSNSLRASGIASRIRAVGLSLVVGRTPTSAESRPPDGDPHPPVLPLLAVHLFRPTSPRTHVEDHQMACVRPA